MPDWKENQTANTVDLIIGREGNGNLLKYRTRRYGYSLDHDMFKLSECIQQVYIQRCCKKTQDAAMKKKVKHCRSQSTTIYCG